MAARLKERFEKEIRPTLVKELGLKNPMQAPRVEKVVVNMGLGEAIQNGKILDASLEQLTAITGQKPVVTKARKSIANFKLRQGQSIGAMVTLRGDRAYEFLDRLLNVALPRVRDFKGVSPKAFDGKGNYTLGREGADHLPGDQLRQGREDQGTQHHRGHHGTERRGGQGAAPPPRHALPPVAGPGDGHRWPSFRRWRRRHAS